MKYLLIICTSLMLLGHRLAAASSIGDTTIQDDYFGLHIRWGAISTPWPFANFSSWRVITPETEWRGLQPQPNTWKFDALDRAIAIAEERKVDAILTLGQTPRWASARPNEPSANGQGFSAEPRDVSDWNAYVRKVVQRYRGRIKYYEIWNEPYYSDLRGYTTKGHFSGSVANMIQLAEIAHTAIREIDPQARIISPSCTGGFDIGLACVEAFFKAGGGRFIDIVGFHLYVTPEKIPPLVASIQTIKRRYGYGHLPIWNTESGYLVSGPDKQIEPQRHLGDPFDFVLSPDEVAGYVLRGMVLAAISGVTRYYHYSWDIPSMHLTAKRGLEPTIAAIGYSQAIRWLRGATLSDLKKDGDVYSVRIKSRKGHSGMLVWGTHPGSPFVIPADFDATGVESLTSPFSPLNDRQVSVGKTPILLRKESALW